MTPADTWEAHERRRWAERGHPRRTRRPRPGKRRSRPRRRPLAKAAVRGSCDERSAAERRFRRFRSLMSRLPVASSEYPEGPLEPSQFRKLSLPAYPDGQSRKLPSYQATRGFVPRKISERAVSAVRELPALESTRGSRQSRLAKRRYFVRALNAVSRGRPKEQVLARRRGEPRHVRRRWSTRLRQRGTASVAA